MGHTQRFVLLGLVVFWGFSTRAGQNTQELAIPVPTDGNTVAFVGDSITWQDYYPEYIEAYFIRRHPEAKIRFVSLGVRGDTASGVVERLARDLYPLDPNLVFVMLGMNDGGYRGYNPLLYRFYLAGMDEIVDLVKTNTKADLVLLSPTCMDSVSYSQKRYNRMLLKMAEGLRDLASRRRVPFVDIQAPFARALEKAKEFYPHVSLMKDNIHPGQAGHLVIAGVLLDRLDPTNSRQHMLVSFDVSVLSWKDHTACISFSHPNDNIYLPRRALEALALVPNPGRFSSRRMIITGLKTMARVYIDGKLMGVFSPEDFVRGIQVDRLEKAPWVSDARLLYELLREKWQLTYYLWDPLELGQDAWRQVSGTRAKLTKKNAYDRLVGILSRIGALRVVEERQYRVCIEKLP